MKNKYYKNIVDALIVGLKKSYFLHKKLGRSGCGEIKTNQFGEKSLLFDMMAEKTIIDSFESANISAKVLSEEHGQIYTNSPTTPDITLIIDGLDGSLEYIKSPGNSMYGTMACVLNSSVDPTYDDYIVCGIAIHSPKQTLFLAIKNEGCFKIDMITNKKTMISLSRSQHTTRNKKIIDLDINYPKFNKLYKSVKSIKNKITPIMQCKYLSIAARTALFLTQDIDIAIEWTRKGNFELPVMYGLVTEFGGVMMAQIGGDNSNKLVPMKNLSFKSFGQRQHRTLIIAPSEIDAFNVVSTIHSISNSD